MSEKMNHENVTTENTERHGKKKKGLVPRLRFPEFRDSGEWVKRPLSELLTESKHRNRDLKYSREQVLSVSGEYGCVNQIELLGRSYAGVSVKDYHVVETGDIVYTKSPLKQNPFGIIKKNKGKPGIVSTLYAVYRVTDKGNSTYLDHYFSNDYNLNSYLQPIVRKGAKNDMKVNNFAVLGGEIIVPKPPEQQKIADCLTSLDELITAEAGKLEACKTHKKGLMQKLFPAEGETLPEWRFPEFQDSGEWEEKRLEEICDINPSNTGLPDTFVYIDLESVDAGELKVKKKIYRVDAPSRAQRVLQHGDVIYQIVRPYQKNNFFCAFDDDYNYVASTGYAQLRAFGSKEFLYQIIHEDNFVGRVIAKCTGSNYPAINSSDLAKIHLAIPSLPEQQKIADCLSSLDEFITAQAQKIETLKAHKKGLMQGLFPSAEENI
jgi:type I restriction enzyme S subunit